MGGPGRPSPGGEGTNFLVGGVRSAAGWQRRLSWDAPHIAYAGDRDASPTRREAPVGLASHSHVYRKYMNILARVSEYISCVSQGSIESIRAHIGI